MNQRKKHNHTIKADAKGRADFYSRTEKTLISVLKVIHPPFALPIVNVREFFRIKIMKPIDLIEHPEGGRFREVFKSAYTVSKHDGTSRSALTHIYFSLYRGEISRFHKVSSDEVWNLYQGIGIKLYTWDGTNTPPKCVTLSASDNCFCHVVPSGIWQAAKPISEAVLVGCSVAPGFEFSDFTLMDLNSQEAKKLISLVPEMAGYIAH